MAENFENVPMDQELDPKVMAEITKKVEELKAANPKVKVIFPLVVEGSEYDEKELYIAYFQQPSFSAFSKYMSASQTSQAVALRTLANDCFLAGDKELIDDDSLFLFGLMGQFNKVLEIRNGRLVNLSKAGK